MIHRFTIKRTDSDMIYTRQEELMAPQTIMGLANDCFSEGFYADASYYYKRCTDKPSWVFVSSALDYRPELPRGRIYGRIDARELDAGKEQVIYHFQY